MRKIKNVTIRRVGNEWQVATTYGGLYNPLKYCPTKDAAVQYTKDNGWKFIIEDEPLNRNQL